MKLQATKNVNSVTLSGRDEKTDSLPGTESSNSRQVTGRSINDSKALNANDARSAQMHTDLPESKVGAPK